MTHGQHKVARCVCPDGAINDRTAVDFDYLCSRATATPARTLRGRGCPSLAVFLMVLALSGAPDLVEAGEASGIFRISLTVVASCNVHTHPLAFAPYATGGVAVGTAVPGSIDVSCTRGVPAAVYLEGERVLTGPDGARVTYALQANGHAWPVGEPLRVQGRGSEPVSLSITGTVFAGQRVPVGDYVDEKVIRVVY